MKRSKRLLLLLAVLAVACVATLVLTKYEEKQEEIQNSDAVILEIAADEVEAVSWKISDASLAFHREGDGWLYDEDEDFPVSEEKITALLEHFEAFGVRFIIKNVEDYSQYGLDDPEGTLQLTTSEGSYEVKLGNFSTMDEQRYVDIGDGNVYLVSEDPAEYLPTELSAMILHDETPDFEQVSEISYEGSETYTITYTKNSPDSYSEDDVYFTEKDGKTVPLDTDTVTTYLNTIETLNLQTYATYHATQEELERFGLDEPQLSVSVAYIYTDEEENLIEDSYVLHLGQNQEELKKAEEARENQEENIPDVTKYVRVGDSQIIYEIEDTTFDLLSAASYNDLRHKEVFWADSDDITQIDVTLDGENYTFSSEIDKEDDKTRIWHYKDQVIDLTDLRTALKTMEAEEFTDASADQKEELSLTLYLNQENFKTVQITLYRYDGKDCLAVVDGNSVSLVERSCVTDLTEAIWTIVL